MTLSFSHIVVLFSLLVGFAVSEVISSWGQLIRLRDRVDTYWIHTGWMVLMLLLLIQLWWGVWDVRHVEEWGLLDMLLLLSEPMLLILAIFVFTPKVSEEDETDLEAFYWHNMRWFFLLGVGTLVVITVSNLTLDAAPVWGTENAVRGAAALLLTVLAVWRNRRFHAVALFASYGLLATFLGLSYLVLDT